jgi:hypothetical protein
MNFYKPASTDRTKGTDCRACLPCVGLGQDQCWLLDLHVQSAFMFRNPKHLPTNRANVCVLFSGGFALRRNCLQGRAIGVFRGYLPPPKYLQEGLKGRRLDKLWTLVSGTGLPLQKITPRMMISMLSTHKKVRISGNTTLILRLVAEIKRTNSAGERVALPCRTRDGG